MVRYGVPIGATWLILENNTLLNLVNALSVRYLIGRQALGDDSWFFVGFSWVNRAESCPEKPVTAILRVIRGSGVRS